MDEHCFNIFIANFEKVITRMIKFTNIESSGLKFVVCTLL